ncbi:MAG: heme-binding protein [Gammaproteobacteria bacterium]|nr:heme-binding protein [Gammaproteobacteria bacterium]NIR32845.1 heme-binding protein [Gammaproteobacteria bacterium]NIR99392.1 heme-binding protein [Gammaproteobacteria bacterium]NIT65006.1 heme-binding protein [Gammaproteobacteria bacterium]NIV21920.1 heme-binding protein [Gammaproteobacteria bacterium]
MGLAAALSAARAGDPAYVHQRALSMELANRLAMAAAEACREQGYRVAAAVVDRSGLLLALVRDPLAGAHTVEVARRKAYSAASFQSATLDLQGRSGMQRLNGVPDVLLVGGGVPVQVGGQFYGAVGVSGASAEKVTGDRDDGCARAGIEAIRDTLEFAD